MAPLWREQGGQAGALGPVRPPWPRGGHSEPRWSEPALPGRTDARPSGRSEAPGSPDGPGFRLGSEPRCGRPTPRS